MAMEFICACSSQKGLSKEVNQDSVLLIRARTETKDEIVFAVICDGVGGMKKGERTSAAVAVAFEQWFHRWMPTLISQMQLDVKDVLWDEWAALIKQLHSQIKATAHADGIQSGTTLEVLLLCCGKYYICHIGDCRVYMLHKRLEQLTHDQTYVQREVDAGRMTLEQARRDKNQSLLLQCVGAGADDIQPDFITGQFDPGQMFFLCCDGQRRRLSGAEMETRLLRAKRRPAQKRLDNTLNDLAELCRKRGEKDDISAILIAQKRRGILPLSRQVARDLPSSIDGEVCVLQKELLIHTEEFPSEGGSNKNETLG